MKTKNELAASSGRMTRLVRHLYCVLAGHLTYATKTDGKSNLRRSPVDDYVETECDRCGETLRAPYCATTIKAGRRRQLKLPSWEGGFSG